MPDRKQDEERKGGVGLKEHEEQKSTKPPMYRVLLHNDDFTPMHWVVALLRHVFRKGEDDATRIMLHVHQRGFGIGGVYTHEIAETKVAVALQFAEKDEHPFMCTMEPES